METTTHHDPNSNLDRPDHPDLDLYTIPSHSSWFCWDEIHETERVALREFFHGTSISRTPKIYKEYRDFIINKYREEPSRRLTFTEVRKSLVGDVSMLHKVFLFLEKWGLINFGAPSGGDSFMVEEEVSKVMIEEGAPNGIRVVAVPNSLKPISVPSVKKIGDTVEGTFKLPPLASYSDVFGDLMKQKESVCGNCGEHCDSGHYESFKDKFIICVKCFKNENFGENKSKEEFEFCDHNGSSGKQSSVWTEADILLLLESVLKHGDDWELVAQNVQNKNKLDCISKLLEMPFGELIFGSSHGKDDSCGPNEHTTNAKQVQHSSSNHQQITNTEDPCHEQTIESEKEEDAVSQGPPTKKKRISSLSDAGGSLMKQVAHFSTMFGPHITAAAADAAVTALCNESSCLREIFDGEDDDATNMSLSPTLTSKLERAHQGEDSDMQEMSTQLETQEAIPKNDIPMTLRIRAAIGTALGAAAARAKLLADQEDKEIEHLMATIIETQLKKLHCKIEHFEELELIMKKEYDAMEEVKEHIVAERIDVLQSVFSAGISRWRDQTSIKPQTGNFFSDFSKE